jgi:PAS domain S-box-containing protein
LERPLKSSSIPQTNPWFRKLNFKITISVFLSIIVVEAIILLPSYLNFKDDLLSRIEEIGQARFVSAFRAMPGSENVEDLIKFGKGAVQASDIKGAVIYDPAGLKVGAFGDIPKLQPGQKTLMRLDSEGQNLDVIWSPEVVNSRFGFVVRLDASEVDDELGRFVLRISGLVMLISVFVCAVTMFILRHLVLRNVLSIETWLSAINLDSDSTTIRPLIIPQKDELGDMVSSLQNMVDRSLSTLSELRETRGALAKINEELEQEVKQRTASLHAEMQGHKKTSAAYRGLFENSVQGIFQTTTEGTFIDLNNAFANMFGYQSTDEMKSAIGDVGSQLWVDQDNWAAMLGDLDRDGKTTGEYQMWCKDGRSIWVHMSIWTGAAEGHIDNGYVEGIFEDISERKRIEQIIRNNEQRYRTLYHEIPAGVTLEDYSLVKQRIDALVLDGISDLRQYFLEHDDELEKAIRDVRVVSANLSMAKLYGMETSDEILDSLRRFEAWNDTEWRQFYIGEFAAMAAGDPTFSAEILDATVNDFPVEIRCTSRIVDGCEEDWSEVISIQEDITEQKKISKMQSEFVSTVSHELRTPLTSIKGSLGLIKSGSAGDLPDNVKSLLDIADSNSKRLLRLIDDILDIGKIDAGKLYFDMVPVDLGEMLKLAVQSNEGYGVGYDVGVVLSNEVSGAVVTGDQERLIQVVSNLVSNATKYSPAGEQVEVSLCVHDGGFRVAVADRGSGVPEDFRDNIFGKFSQADSSDTRQKDGTGLGLYISKAIIEQHGGTIGFDAEKTKGTTFYFYLPGYFDLPGSRMA